MKTPRYEGTGIDRSGRYPKEARPMKRRWNELIRTLLLIRLGQELGQGGPLAVAVRDFLDGLFTVVR